MDKATVMRDISQRMKLIRTEMDYSQDRMAGILGLSKKTLVEIEKGRKDAGWAVVVAICALFPESDVIRGYMGEDPLSILQVLSRHRINQPKIRTMGGRVWWKEIDAAGGFRIQQNIISSHYRILDKENGLWFSSFSREEAVKRLFELSGDQEGSKGEK